jgi:hypothetical protein
LPKITLDILITGVIMVSRGWEMRNLQKEIKELKAEIEEKSELLHLSYDRLADGGRGLADRIARKVVNPETADALRRAFC